MKTTYIDHMGTDLSVVNAARVSFGKASEWVYDETERRSGCGGWVSMKENRRLSKADTGLIQFLARGCTSGDWDNLFGEITRAGHSLCDDEPFDYKVEEINELLRHIRKMPTHWTPFGHTAITLHIKAPIFVARQLGKHQVGMVWNEVSRRYVTDEPELYIPDEWRNRADNVKQGSSDTSVPFEELFPHDDVCLSEEWSYGDFALHAVNMYKYLLIRGVCPEQARMVLPQSMMTEWYWTGNLYAFANVFIQRSDSHAQREVQVIAKQIGDIIEPLFPVSWHALTS